MKKRFFLILWAIVISMVLVMPNPAAAATGIFASGGGTKTVGETFTISVSAQGAEFDSLQGVISVSGPVEIASFSAGGATWLPGKSPSNGGQFVGIVSPTSSLTVATINLKGTDAGDGEVSVSGTKLARNGAIVSTEGGSTSFTIQGGSSEDSTSTSSTVKSKTATTKKTANLPGTVNVSSTSHPDQNASYETPTIVLSWDKPTGVTAFSYLLDDKDNTTPPEQATSSETTITYENQTVGVHYFHIRGQNASGWGETTHFKITIKEADAMIDSALAKPSYIKIKKTSKFTNNIKDGLVSGIIISGKVEPGFNVNLAFVPALPLPAGKSLIVKSDASGRWSYAIDFPIKSGFYQLIAQGQKEKVLTPLSSGVNFEISQAKGGRTSILTDRDSKSKDTIMLILTGIVIVLIVVGGIVYNREQKKRYLGY